MDGAEAELVTDAVFRPHQFGFCPVAYLESIVDGAGSHLLIDFPARAV